ncbi:MAG: metalloregulator ArsR/SmtB family transcription factor, partial [Acidimicrobiia bacterium]|nr:metalloregulator ArsR/SmtB family transcription factor [Acidimicrobiia bacterium]
MNGSSNPELASTATIDRGAAMLEHLSVLSDPVRCRALAVLEQDELTVSELCGILQLPQSTMSRHLKTLAEDGWVDSRRDGTSRRYVAAPLGEGSPASQVWKVARTEVAAGPAAATDRKRLQSVLADRRRRSQEYFTGAAAEWTETRASLFGQDFDRVALLGLLDRTWVVGDLGTGSGQMSMQLAPFVDRVIAVDESEAMLQAARDRLAGEANVEVRAGRLEALPIADGELDAAMLVLVLHYVPDPSAAIAEASRAIAAGGRILIVDMLPHDRTEYRRSMGHLWLGFDPDTIGEWLAAAGFDRPIVGALPADVDARGPALFAASATKLT